MKKLQEKINILEAKQEKWEMFLEELEKNEKLHVEEDDTSDFPIVYVDWKEGKEFNLLIQGDVELREEGIYSIQCKIVDNEDVEDFEIVIKNAEVSEVKMFVEMLFETVSCKGMEPKESDALFEKLEKKINEAIAYKKELLFEASEKQKQQIEISLEYEGENCLIVLKNEENGKEFLLKTLEEGLFSVTKRFTTDFEEEAVFDEQKISEKEILKLATYYLQSENEMTQDEIVREAKMILPAIHFFKNSNFLRNEKGTQVSFEAATTENEIKVVYNLNEAESEIVFSYVKDGVEHDLTTEGTQEKFEQVYNIWKEMDEKIDVCGIEEITALFKEAFEKDKIVEEKLEKMYKEVKKEFSFMKSKLKNKKEIEIKTDLGYMEIKLENQNTWLIEFEQGEEKGEMRIKEEKSYDKTVRGLRRIYNGLLYA